MRWLYVYHLVIFRAMIFLPQLARPAEFCAQGGVIVAAQEAHNLEIFGMACDAEDIARLQVMVL